MSKYYFHLKNVPYPLSIEGDNWLKSLPEECHVDIPRTYFSAEYQEWLSKFDLNIWNGEVFSMPPNYQLQIHVDATEFSDKGKMNWAFCDGEQFNLWFVPNANWKEQATVEMQDDGKVDDYSFMFEQHEVTEVERVALNNPTVVNAGQPHSVITTTHPRKSVSVIMIPKDFKPPHKDWGIPIDDLRELFKDHVL
jgi:hypothetical protein